MHCACPVSHGQLASRLDRARARAMWSAGPHRVLLDAARDDLAVAPDGGLPAQEDQAGDLRGMCY